jgi:maleate isomerase
MMKAAKRDRAAWNRAALDRDDTRGGKMTEDIRLGVIVPSVNSVVEAWYPRAVPDGVSVHFARMLMPGTAPERIIEMDRTDGVRSIHQLASCRPHAIAYGCTASSIVQGHQFDAHVREEIQQIAGCPGTSATNAIFAACERLGLRRVTAISPYPEAVDAAEHRFFAEGGVETIAGACLGISDGFGLAEPAPATIRDFALAAWNPASDGMIIACLNFRSHPVIDELEERIGKPVVTSTQATLWHILRLAGVAAPIPGYGRLLREF